MCRGITFSDIERRLSPSFATEKESHPRWRALGFALIIIGTLSALACISTVIASAGSYQGWWHVNLHLSRLELGILVGAGVVSLIVACLAIKLLNIPLRRTSAEPELVKETPEAPQIPVVDLETPQSKPITPYFLSYPTAIRIPPAVVEDLKSQGIEAHEGLSAPCFIFHHITHRVDIQTVSAAAEFTWNSTQGNCVWIFLSEEIPTAYFREVKSGFKGQPFNLSWRLHRDLPGLTDPIACAKQMRTALEFYSKGAGHV